MNNRKQKIHSVLDSLTQKELEEYIKERKLNIKKEELLKKIKLKKEFNHFEKISNLITVNLNNILSKYYKLGQARIIAFILVCFYDNKYKIKDIKSYMKQLIDDDKELKEYVYDCMKDF